MPRGKTTSTPLSADGAEKLTALVRESIGFNKERGDSVKLINAPFRTEATAEGRRRADVAAALAARHSCARPRCRLHWCWWPLLVVSGVIEPGAQAAAGPTIGRQLDARGRRFAAPAAARRGAGAGRAVGRQAAHRRALRWPNKTRPRSRNIVRGWVGDDAGLNALAGGSTMDDKGIENAAILLMSLGEEEAAEVFKPPGAERGADAWARPSPEMKSMPRERVDERAGDVHQRGVRAAACWWPTPTST